MNVYYLHYLQIMTKKNFNHINLLLHIRLTNKYCLGLQQQQKETSFKTYTIQEWNKYQLFKISRAEKPSRHNNFRILISLCGETKNRWKKLNVKFLESHMRDAFFNSYKQGVKNKASNCQKFSDKQDGLAIVHLETPFCPSAAPCEGCLVFKG